MSKEPKKIIIDTCILYLIYGADRKEKTDKKFYRLSNVEKMLFLAKNNFMKIYITPQIFKEFKMCEGKNPKAQANFAAFVKKYLTILTFDDSQTKTISKLVWSFGHERVKENGKNGKKIPAFRLAKKPGDKNYADTVIMAEATMAKIDIVTNNFKDFKGFRYIDKLAEKNGFDVPYVYSLENFFTSIFNPKQIAWEKSQKLQNLLTQ